MVRGSRKTYQGSREYFQAKFKKGYYEIKKTDEKAEKTISKKG